MKYKNLDASPPLDYEGYPQYVQRDSRDVMVIDSDELLHHDTGVLNQYGGRILRARNDIGFGR